MKINYLKNKILQSIRDGSRTPKKIQEKLLFQSLSYTYRKIYYQIQALEKEGKIEKRNSFLYITDKGIEQLRREIPYFKNF